MNAFSASSLWLSFDFYFRSPGRHNQWFPLRLLHLQLLPDISCIIYGAQLLCSGKKKQIERGFQSTFGQSLQISIQWNVNRTKGCKSISSSSWVHHEHMKIKTGGKVQLHEVVCTKQHMAQHWWQIRKKQSAFHCCHLPFALALHRALSDSKTEIQITGPAQNPAPAKEMKHKEIWAPLKQTIG